MNPNNLLYNDTMNAVQSSHYITRVSVTSLVPDCIIAMSPVIAAEAVRIARPVMSQHHGAVFSKSKHNSSVEESTIF